jgi:hypothetical protein
VSCAAFPKQARSSTGPAASLAARPLSATATAAPAMSFAVEDVIKLGIPVCDQLSRSARPFATKALTQALRWGLEYLAVFPTLCLRRQPVKLLKEACSRFVKGELDALFNEAKSSALAARAAVSSPTPTTFVMEETDLASASGSEAIIPGPTLARAQALASMGYLARASATLNCAALAPDGPETLLKLQALHPAGSGFPPQARTPFDPLCEQEVKKALCGIGRGSVGGPTRLSRDHLVTCIGDPAQGGLLLSALTQRVNELVDLPLASTQRQWFFGARLVALAKKDGGVRPVAVGEISRRILAKALLARHSLTLGQLLLRSGQVGVGIPSGAEALAAAAQRLAAVFDEDADVLLKIDLKNAFNTVRRAAMLRGLERLAAEKPEVAELLRYVYTAYGADSTLFYFDRSGATHTLSSAEGCQQGDPLGPLLFAAALAMAMSNTFAAMESLMPAPALIGTYLDDLVIGGGKTEVSFYITLLREELGDIGLMLNLTKCEVHGSWDAEVGEDLFASMRSLDLTNWELLGVPCGQVEDFLARRVDQVGWKLKQFASLPAHLAFLLARHCGAFPLLQYWLRTVGAAGQQFFDAADSLSLGFLSGLVGPIPPEVAPAVFLPPAHGGLGLLRCGGALPTIAHFASLRASLPVFAGLLPSWPSSMFEDLAWEAGASLDLPEVLPTRKLQHLLGQRLHTNTAAAYLADTSVSAEARHRFRMGGYLRTTAVLSPPYDLVSSSPLSSGLLFASFVRFRLGLPFSSCAVPCLTSCGAMVGCVGDHALSCMRGGDKQSWHFALLREVARLCSLALWNPRLEVHPFPEAASLRMDLLLPPGTFDPFKAALVDVSIVNTSSSQPSSAPNKAAEIAAKAKTNKYGPHVDAHHIFVPLIFETTGGVSALVPAFLDKLSKAITARLEVDGGRQYVRQCVVNTLAKSVSSRLVKQFASSASTMEMFPPPPSAGISRAVEAVGLAQSSGRPSVPHHAARPSTSSVPQVAAAAPAVDVTCGGPGRSSSAAALPRPSVPRRAASSAVSVDITYDGRSSMMSERPGSSSSTHVASAALVVDVSYGPGRPSSRPSSPHVDGAAGRAAPIAEAPYGGPGPSSTSMATVVVPRASRPTNPFRATAGGTGVDTAEAEPPAVVV